MKVEVEFSEIEKLKQEISDLRKENYNLRKHFSEISEEELLKKAQRHSYFLFKNYMKKVFDELGFDGCENYVHVDYNMEHFVGDKFWETDKIKIEVGAKITNHFRKLFLEMGIKTETN